MKLWISTGVLPALPFKSWPDPCPSSQGEIPTTTIGTPHNLDQVFAHQAEVAKAPKPFGQRPTQVIKIPTRFGYQSLIGRTHR